MDRSKGSISWKLRAVKSKKSASAEVVPFQFVSISRNFSSEDRSKFVCLCGSLMLFCSPEYLFPNSQPDRATTDAFLYSDNPRLQRLTAKWLELGFR